MNKKEGVMQVMQGGGWVWGGRSPPQLNQKLRCIHIHIHMYTCKEPPQPSGPPSPGPPPPRDPRAKRTGNVWGRADPLSAPPPGSSPGAPGSPWGSLGNPEGSLGGPGVPEGFLGGSWCPWMSPVGVGGEPGGAKPSPATLITACPREGIGKKRGGHAGMHHAPASNI